VKNCQQIRPRDSAARAFSALSSDRVSSILFDADLLVAESLLTRRLFGSMLRRIRALPVPTD